MQSQIYTAMVYLLYSESCTAVLRGNNKIKFQFLFTLKERGYV